MDCLFIKHLLKWPISNKSKHFVREYINNIRTQKLRLIMTLVVRNEEDIIEKHIRFHCAMGVDGVIVTSHKSTDKTNEILRKLKNEGLVLEILEKNTPDHKHSIWVNEMIKLAKNKFSADWIINADADEFYYSKDLNLKESIMEYSKTNVNVLIVYSTFYYPTDENDFLMGKCNNYFIKKPFKDFEIQQLNMPDNKTLFNFTNYKGCPKVIHKVKGFKKILDGNHEVKMNCNHEVPAFNITLYHYHTRNYKGLEEKLARWIDSVNFMKKEKGALMKFYIDLYQKDKLKEYYDELYGENTRKILIENGVISIDNSVKNFLGFKIEN